MSAALMHIRKLAYRSNERCLCAMYSGPASEQVKQPLGDKGTALCGVLSGARLDGCTLNFNMYTSDKYGLSSSTVEYYHHKRKA